MVLQKLHQDYHVWDQNSFLKNRKYWKTNKGVKFKLFKNTTDNFSELGVSGKNIMKGYLFDKKLTIRSFKKDFYLTGDLAYVDKDGSIILSKGKIKL